MEIFYLILWSFIINVVSSGKLARLYDMILADLDNKTTYDNRIRPFYEEKPVEVVVDMDVQSLRSISATAMDFSLELFFREYWRDPRLSFSAENITNTNGGYLQMHDSIVGGMWVPDTYMPNALTSSNPKVESISHRTLLRLKPDGSVLLSRRISVTAECGMDFSLFPFDRQVCLLSIESYGNTIDDITYSWRGKEAVGVPNKVYLPDFILTQIKLVERNTTTSTGTYSRLECCFFFKREPLFYCVQYFLPSLVVVLAAWLLLLLSQETTIGEIVGVILSLTFLFFSYISILPSVAYVKAMDVFFGACFVVVSFALIQLSYSKWVASQNKKQVKADGLSLPDGVHSSSPIAILRQRVKKMNFLHSLFIGKIPDGNKSPVIPLALILFPIMFILFCVLYFIVYLVVLEDKNLNHCVFD